MDCDWRSWSACWVNQHWLLLKILDEIFSTMSKLEQRRLPTLKHVWCLQGSSTQHLINAWEASTEAETQASSLLRLTLSDLFSTGALRHCAYDASLKFQHVGGGANLSVKCNIIIIFFKCFCPVCDPLGDCMKTLVAQLKRSGAFLQTAWSPVCNSSQWPYINSCWFWPRQEF